MASDGREVTSSKAHQVCHRMGVGPGCGERMVRGLEERRKNVDSRRNKSRLGNGPCNRGGGARVHEGV